MEGSACPIIMDICPDYPGGSGIVRPYAGDFKFKGRKMDGAQCRYNGIQERRIDLSDKLQGNVSAPGVHQRQLRLSAGQDRLAFPDSFSDREGQINSNKNSHHQTE
jgi:hypothetical protein